VMGSVPGHYAGTASGINNAASRVAGLLAIALFGLLMLAVFSVALRSGLAGLELPAQAEAAVYAQRNDLAALEPPPELSTPQQGAVQQLVSCAYLTGFRVVMAVSAGLALVSALIAWRLVGRESLR